MPKLKLELDRLEVRSFVTSELAQGPRGTVRGHGDTVRYADTVAYAGGDTVAAYNGDTVNRDGDTMNRDGDTVRADDGDTVRGDTMGFADTV